MTVTTIPTAGITDDAVGNTKLDLTENYAFTGTITGTPQTLVKTGSLVSTSDAGSYSLDSCFSATYLNYFVTFKYAIATDGNKCYLRFRTGGSTNSVSKYQGYIRYGDNAGNTGAAINSYDDHAQIANDLEATDTKAIQGFMYIFSPFSTTYLTNATLHYNAITQAGNRRMYFGGVQFDDTTSFDGFQLTQNTGNGSLVDLQCWGIKE